MESTFSQSELIIVIFGTTILVMLVAAFISVYLVYQRRLLKQKNQLQEMELQLQRRVMSAIIDTQEMERKRLAEDIHDEMGALILALKLGNHSLLVNEQDESQKERIQHNEELIEDIAQRVRNVSQNLLPDTLKNGHFEKALHSLFDLFSENTDLQCSLTAEEKPIQIPYHDRVSLYRVINEWLSNVVKHSKSSELDLEIKKNGRFYYFTSEDNGSKFNYQKALANTTGLGLRSMQGRLAKMGAQFIFSANEKGGTKFEIKYPYIEKLS